MTLSLASKTPDTVKIGFLTSHDPTDRRAWSGIIHYLATSLAKHAGEVVYLGPASSDRETQLENWGRRCRHYLGKSYDVSHSLYLSSGYADIFHSRLQKTPVDVIFAPVASTEIALLKTAIPIVYMSDTTFAAMQGYYREFSNFFALSRFEANFIERSTVRKATRLIYPSQWAADSASKDYGAGKDKIHVFPMGANIDTVPTDEQISNRQRGDHIRLLFVGVDWHRKGGPVAFETLKALKQSGISASLTVVGCVPPAEFSDPSITVIPFLNKNNPDERKQLSDLYLNSDFFILPTIAECMGIVFCEAAASGLPSLAYATGGVPSVIEHNQTGYLFDLNANGADYAHTITELWRDTQRLDAMVAASRERFKKHLNWDVWGRQAASVIHQAAGIVTQPIE